MARRLWIPDVMRAASLALALGCAAGATQQAAAQKHRAGLHRSVETLPATYEVAIIRPSRGGRPDVDLTADSFVGTNLTLQELLVEAYGIRGDLIGKVPGPLGTARFDVTAKIVDPDAIERAKTVDRGAMLLQVLEDRFHLEAHVVKRTEPVYEMTVLSGGPKFKETPASEAHGESMDAWRRRIQGRDTPMRSLAAALSDMVDHYVIDKTGLPGAYDFTLRWTNDTEQNPDVEAPPDLFAAIEEQLGLRLRKSKAQVDTLFVDSAEMPEED